MEQEEQTNEFEAVKTRLAEIADAVDDESLSLDEALDLYEEAVKLGLQASNLLEVGIVVEDEAEADSQDEAGAEVPAMPDSNPDVIPAAVPIQSNN